MKGALERFTLIADMFKWLCAARLVVLTLVIATMTGAFGSQLVGTARAAQAADCVIEDSGGAVHLPPELAELLDNEVASGEGKQICEAVPAAVDVGKPNNGQVAIRSKFNGAVAAISGRYVPDEVLVTIEGDGAVVRRVAALYGLDVRGQDRLSLLGVVLVRFGIPDGRPVAVVRSQLLLDDDVVEAEPNHIYELNGDENKQTLERFSLEAAEINSAQKTALGRGVKIAIIDTGVDDNHGSLKGAIKARFNGLGDLPLNDTSHGTTVALLAGGAGAGFLGAAPEAELYMARAFDKTKDGTGINSVHAILLSLDWAFLQSVDIINMSFAGPENKLLTKSLKNLMQENVILVAAAGNEGANAPFAFPAAQEGVFAVTATDAKNRIYGKANRGPYVFVAAPGVDVVVTMGPDRVQLKSGTSYGAALFSGICALALEGYLQEGRKRPKLDDFRGLVMRSVKDLGPTGRDPVFGVGLIRAAELLRQVAH